MGVLARLLSDTFSGGYKSHTLRQDDRIRCVYLGLQAFREVSGHFCRSNRPDAVDDLVGEAQSAPYLFTSGKTLSRICERPPLKS